MRRSNVITCFVLALTLLALLAGCASSNSQICVRDPLERPEMRFDDTAHRDLFDDHVYFSKEATSGGQGVGGGGCGCN